MKRFGLSTTQQSCQFERGCLHSICVLEAFDSEAESAPAVCSSSGSKKTGCAFLNLFNILMASPASAESLMAFLKCHVRSEFSDSARAVFCLWFEQLMEVVSDSARVRPVPERSNRDIRVAHRVTNKMRSMRSGFDLYTDFFWQYGGVGPRLARSRRSSGCR